MITLTQIAQDKINEIAEAEGVAKSIRARVLGGGCAGLTFDLEFQEVSLATDADEVIDVNGISILVDQISAQYLDDMTIDYVDGGIMGSGFKFTSPSIKSTCACGSSVAF